MEKRSTKRVPAGIKATLFHGNLFYSGTILNFSEKGIFIKTKIYFPPESMFVMIVRPEEKLLIRTIARVKRVTETRNSLCGMGIELVDPPVNYLDHIKRMKTAR